MVSFRFAKSINDKRYILARPDSIQFISPTASAQQDTDDVTAVGRLHNANLMLRDQFSHVIVGMNEAIDQIFITLIFGKTRRSVLTGIAIRLMGRQRSDGHLPSSKHVSRRGNIYPTAMAILSLTPAYQILPIYQQ